MSAAAEPQVATVDPSLWRALTAEGADRDDAAFGDAWLGLAARMVAGASAALLVLLPGGGADPLVCTWPAGARPDPGLLAAAHNCLKAGRGTVQPVPTGTASRIAYPVRVGEADAAAAVFDVAGDARTAMRQVQWAAAWLRDWRRGRDVAAAQRVAERTTLALDLLAAALEEPGFAAACRLAATELASRFDCDRVAIGFARRRRAAVVGISHTAQFGRSMSLVRQLAEAMDEAMDQHGPVLHPPPDGADSALVTRAHAMLAASHGAGFVLTVPMFVRDRFVGAATFERAPGRPFDQTAIDLIESVVAILGPALLDKRAMDRPLPVLAATAIADQARHTFGPGYWGRKLTLAAVVTVLAFGAFARGPYRVAAEARVEGAVQRAMVAPFDGFIAEAAVRAGDTVRAGQTLATLDDRDLVLERLRWVTERQQHLAEYDQALSQGKRADAARYRALGDEASAQMRLIDEQLARTHVVAPFDGLVVSGDLSQSIGAPARRGDVLFEVAPLNDWRVVLRVPESQVADIVPGQRGALLVGALPDVALALTVRRIVPVAEAHEGRMLFQVDAALDETTPRLRPGMEGLAHVDAGRARLVWIWFRSLLHWARVESWAWLP
jgi:multidrug efflux pump subunit AcrA (membrane-fusion protein)